MKVMYYNFVLVPELDCEDWSNDFPPGLKLIENIITEEEEKILINSISWSNEGRKILLLLHKTKH